MTYNIGSFSINYIINKEKKAIFNLIKKICLSKNGYIFGGMVRNEIICSYYKNKFIDYINNNQDINFDIEKKKSISSMFWDISIHPESYARVLIPKNMDVFFNDYLDYYNFIQKIENKFDNISIIEDTDTHLFNILNNDLRNIIKNEKILIEIIIGKSFTFNGHKILIEINTYYIKKNHNGIILIEPPFNNLDMLCNIFIHTKNEIRLSKSSGTHLDYQNEFQREKAAIAIKKQIINFETHICSSVENNIHKSYIIKKIIKMMEEEENPLWNFINLPYKIIKNIDIDKIDEILCDELYCCICQEDLKDESKDLAIVYVNNSSGNKIIGCRTHLCCMNKFILYQTDNNPSTYICPYKSPLNFIGLDIDYNY